MATEAYGYARVSGRGQMKGHGVGRQLEVIRDYARQAGYSIAGTYRDAHTGTEASRPAFMEMLAAMLGNGVEVVIVECLDRLARDLMIQTTLLAKLEASGITLIAASTGEDVTASMRDDPMRKALVQIQGVFSELDKSLLVNKLRKGREAKRKAAGRCEGQKPFGFYAGEEAVLERIRQLRRKPRGRERLSVAKVAAKLNAEGHRNRAGGEWQAMNLWKIMRRAGIL